MVGVEDEFIQVTDQEGSDVIELPVERNGTVLLSTIQAQFPSAVGLKYRSSSGGWRGVRAADNILDPPSGGWGETTYHTTEAKKEKTSHDESFQRGDTSSQSSSSTKDIVVFGLSYDTTDDELKEYFTTSCGELEYHEIKVDRDTSKSRGFAFIRFASKEGQEAALEGEHELDGRRLTLRLSKKKENTLKLFIGRLRSGTTKEQVQEYFQEFGELTDVFVPSPFRGFGFVTYDSEREGLRVSRMHHVLNGANLNVTVATPIEESSRRDGYRDSDRMDRRRDRSRSRERMRDRDRDSRNGFSSYDKRSHSSRDRSRYDSRHNEGHSLRDTDREDLKKMLVALLDK